MYRKILAWVALAVIAGAVLFFGLRGCTAMPWNKGKKTSGVASISITRDYGRVTIEKGEVALAGGMTVMEALKSVAEVETEYGGGFVSSIEGLANTGGAERKDWFYYVNGIMAGVGSDEYSLGSGDTVWWDYHAWQGGRYSQAVVGAYPAPFTRGYGGAAGGTEIVYGEGMEAVAREVGSFLEKNGARVEYSGDPGSFEQGGGPAILFLTSRQAQQADGVRGLLSKERGAFVAFGGDGLVALDANGDPAGTPASVACAIVSTAAGMGDTSPVWLVLCGNEPDTERAGALLTTGRAGLENRVGVVIGADGKNYRLPR